MPHVVGGRFKMAPSREATLLRFSIKSAPSPLPKKSPLHPSCLISLASFKAIKASILYMDRKEPHFFLLNTHCAWQNVLWLWKYLKGMFPGPMPLCFVYQSDAFSRMCSNYKDNVSVRRNSSKPMTLLQKRIFTFPNIQNNALFPTGENLSFSWIHSSLIYRVRSLSGFIWCPYFLRKESHSKGKYILSIWR